MTKPTEEKSLDWHEEECRATFDRKQKIMSMFSDNAKTYIAGGPHIGKPNTRVPHSCGLIA